MPRRQVARKAAVSQPSNPHTLFGFPGVCGGHGRGSGGRQRCKSANRDLGISGGRSLTGPFRDARRLPSTRWYPVPKATRTTLGFGMCPSFKGSILCRAVPSLRVTIRNFLIGVRTRRPSCGPRRRVSSPRCARGPTHSCCALPLLLPLRRPRLASAVAPPPLTRARARAKRRARPRFATACRRSMGCVSG
jgi:hypothetical protein